MQDDDDRRSHMRNPGLFLLVAGGVLLAYGLWALHSGWIVSTWARIEYRPSVPYWITVLALIAIGGANVAIGTRLLLR